MLTISKLNRLFPPQYFNKSSVNNMLLTKEKKIFTINRTENNKPKYDTFDELFKLYLTKLPQNKVKKYVSNLFDKRLVFIGSSASARNDAVFSRLLLKNNKLSGVVLDANVLDIDVSTGETSSIDDCVYATYFGLLRAGILSNRQKVLKNKDLHKLLTNYIYRIILRVVGQTVIYNDKQKNLVNMACIYAYYRHFLNQRHPMTLSIIQKDYKEIFNKDQMAEFLPMLKDISKYSSTQDIPKILIDLKVYHDDPKKITIRLLEILGNAGFYSYIGPLDQFIAFMILSKYPTNLYPKTAVTMEKLHDSVESLTVKYIDTLGYETSRVFVT